MDAVPRHNRRGTAVRVAGGRVTQVAQRPVQRVDGVDRRRELDVAVESNPEVAAVPAKVVKTFQFQATETVSRHTNVEPNAVISRRHVVHHAAFRIGRPSV